MQAYKRWVVFLAILAILATSLLTGSAVAGPNREKKSASEETAKCQESNVEVEVEETESPGLTSQVNGAGAESEPPGEETPGDESGQDGLAVAQQVPMAPGTQGGDGCPGPNVPDPTNLEITKTVNSACAPGESLALTKQAAPTEITMKEGDDAQVTYNIGLDIAAARAYTLSGSVRIKNEPTHPAHVIDVSDEVEYRISGPGAAWNPVNMTFASHDFPAGFPEFDIPAGADVTYNYTGTFTLPTGVDPADIAAWRNIIYVTISNHPDGKHRFHHTVSFSVTAGSTVGQVSLSDVETVLDAATLDPSGGVTFAVTGVKIDNASSGDLAGPWPLDFSAVDHHTVEITKKVTAHAAGDYILRNVASAGGEQAEAEVKIRVEKGGKCLGSISGTKWEDIDCDGKGDKPVDGVTIELWKGRGKVGQTTTANGGLYSFGDLELNRWYKVKEALTGTWYAVKPSSGKRAVFLCSRNPDRTGVDFVNARPSGSISGTKWEDVDCDGKGDKPVDGVTIELWKGDKKIGETATANGGLYSFTGLDPGCYTVKEVLDPGWYPKNPDDGAWEGIKVRECKPVTGLDFVNARKGLIHGYKWLDKDGDGEWDAGEPGIPGVTVWLDGETKAVTDSSGYYCFPGLAPGTYGVGLDECTAPPRTYPTGPTSVKVELACGEEERVDFFNAPYASISGFKFWDKDCSGGWSWGDWPMKGVTIELWKGGAKVAEDVTNLLGSYRFGKLTPGIYTVVEVPPTGFYPTFPPKGQHIIDLKCGENRCFVNFYNARWLSISGHKWEDLNCNGRHDCGEPPVGGVTIELWDSKGLVASDVTDGNGAYSFTGLEPGCYVVKEVLTPELAATWYPKCPPDGSWDHVALSCGRNIRSLDFINARYLSISGHKWEACGGEKTGMDGVEIQLWNKDGLLQTTTTSGGGAYSFTGLKPGFYTVKEVLTPEQAEEWYSVLPDDGTWECVKLACGKNVVDLDFINARWLSISGTKWEDADADGAIGGDDKPLDGVTVELLKDGERIAETETADGGKYAFSGLLPGTYTVKEVLEDGWFWVIPDDASHDEVELDYCEPVEGLDFLNCRHGSITGTKYIDADGDGELDPGEEPQQGVEITLTAKGKAAAMATVTTSELGTFSFEGLMPGDYVVQEVVPDGYYQTGHAYWEVYVGPGDEIPVVFLNAPHCSVSGKKWNDSNANGAGDEGETGMGGITVTLSGTTLGGTVINTSTTTNLDGTYSFPGLEAGEYTVSETVPAGMRATSDASKPATLVPGDHVVLDFHNVAIIAGEEVAPVVPVAGEQLPATGWNQFPLVLAAGLLLLAGLLFLALGLVRQRGA